MIIVDTNVISEAVRPGRDPALVKWLDAQVIETLYFTAMSLSELRLGIEILPPGKRKDALSAEINALVANFFGMRILPFDEEAALAYGSMVAAARADGRTVSVTDGQIAAVAQVHGFAVATRDVLPFESMRISVINPWKSS